MKISFHSNLAKTFIEDFHSFLLNLGVKEAKLEDSKTSVKNIICVRLINKSYQDPRKRFNPISNKNILVQAFSSDNRQFTTLLFFMVIFEFLIGYYYIGSYIRSKNRVCHFWYVHIISSFFRIKVIFQDKYWNLNLPIFDRASLLDFAVKLI